MFNIKNFKNVKYSCLYSVNGKISCAFSSESVMNTFGSYLAGLDFRQVRIAETCRYPHVTYYFDGLEEFNDKNLYKILVPSPKVPRFDSKPEMSIADVTSSALQAMDDDFDFILVNFANADMVGHTGNIASIVRALEACDVCVGKIMEKANENFYDLVIVSDHGNVEMMKNDDGTLLLSNTNNKVPFVICNDSVKLKSGGSLKDVIPTVIDLYEISKPKEMTGESLIIKD